MVKQKNIEGYPKKKKKDDLEDLKVDFEEGVFWTQKQRQGHSMHYICPYQASFPPQIPEYFIKNYSELRDRVLDPFCGRGTVILEANNLGRVGVGVDINPLGLQIAKSKMKNVKLDRVVRVLAKPAGFEVEKVLINHISAPKISQAFTENGEDNGTQTNRCVIMRKV